MLKKLLLLLLLLLPLHNYGTHLLGGEITYKHISYNSVTNSNTYRVQVNMYRDCQYGQALLDNSIDIGFYEKVSGSKALSFTLTLSTPDSSFVDPFAGKDYSNCKTLPKACMQWGKYEGDIDLPASSYGYLMLYERCCRKSSIVNVQDSQGQSYTNFIPPNNIVNSSPYFTDPPAPFLGVNDTASYFNNAIDPDGDSLVYSLAYPYTGGTAASPIPSPGSTYIKPGNILYQGGYSFKKPFGSKGMAIIDPVTGLTTIYANKTGNYVIAIDVSEYRNGVLISTTRRDVMLYITSVLSSVKIIPVSTGGFTTADSFAVHAGDQIQFKLKFTGGDTLSYTASGEPLDPTRKPSHASMIDTTMPKAVNTTFVWQTSCSDMRTQPYIIKYTVTNKWCPPSLPLKGTKRIYVIPFHGIDTIYGPRLLCRNQKNVRYYINGVKGNTYSWIVKGDSNYVTSYTGDTIIVNWGSSTSGSITLLQLNRSNCAGDTLRLNVKILPPPVNPVLLGKINVCANETDSYYVKKVDTGTTLAWSVNGGKILKIKNGYAIIKWGTKDSGIVKLTSKNANGCTSDTQSIHVIKNIPQADSIGGTYSVCPNARGIDYYIYRNKTPGSIYIWKITGGKQASGGNSVHITVDWGNKGPGKVQAVEITKYGCVGDTLSFDVSKDYAFVSGPIFGDTSLCEYTAGEKYYTAYVHNSTFTWTVLDGNLATPNGKSNIVVNWGAAGSATLIVTQTAYDSVNGLPCIAKDVYLPVTLHPLPNTGQIQGDSIFCQGNSSTFSVQGLPGSTFTWNYNSGKNNIIGQGNDTITINNSPAGNYVLTVREISADSCIGSLVSRNVVVLPSPKTGSILGPAMVCSPNLNNITYSVNSDASSNYSWAIEGGIINSGNGTPSINVNWQTPGFDSLTVIETNTSGCKDTQKLSIQEDSSEIKVRLVTTLRNNEQQIAIYWDMKNGQFLKGKLQVLRRKAGDLLEVFVDTVTGSKGMYIDKKAEPSKYPYFYRVQGYNNCGNAVSSDTHKSIYLQGQISNTTDSLINLHWNSYFGWGNNIKYYHVLRSINDDSSLKYYSVTTDTNTMIFAGLDAWRQCFRIGAVNALDSGMISYSNKVCFDFEPSVFIPNAFTPDGNFLNDKFHVFANNWKQYNIMIFDRWGEKLFESNDPAIQWDGTFKGAKCQEGVYLYLVTVQGINTIIHKNGTVQILR